MVLREGYSFNLKWLSILAIHTFMILLRYMVSKGEEYASTPLASKQFPMMYARLSLKFLTSSVQRYFSSRNPLSSLVARTSRCLFMARLLATFSFYAWHSAASSFNSLQTRSASCFSALSVSRICCPSASFCSPSVSLSRMGFSLTLVS